MPEQDQIQQIVRVGETDVDGTKRIRDAIKDVAGVSDAYANAVVKNLPFDPETRIGGLAEDELDSIEDLIRNPEEAGIPSWLRNRRKDRETGDDKHLIEADLRLANKFDIRRLKNIKAYRGERHRLGLPVRGQKTQSSFRSGEKIGVQRERIQEEAEEGEE